MKSNLHKKLTIEITLDSSEAIMLNQGGKQSIKLTEEYMTHELDSFDEIDVTFQIEKQHQERFNYISSEAINHRQLWDEINNEEERNNAKLRMKQNFKNSEGNNPHKSKLKGAVIKPLNAAEPSTSSQEQV